MFQYGGSRSDDDTGSLRLDSAGGSAWSVGDIARGLWRARFWALGGAIACVLAAFLLSQVLRPSYEASAQVYVDPQDLQLLRNDISPNLSPGDSGAAFIESQARIMESAGVLRAVVRKLDLAYDREFVSSRNPISRLLSPMNEDAVSDEELEQSAVDALSRKVHVIRADRTYFIEIYARAETATKAADIANAIVSTYMAMREKQRAEQAEQASGSLEQRLDGLRATVRNNEEAVERFKTANNIVVTNSGTLIEKRLGEANLSVSNAERAMDEAKAELDQLNLMKNNPTLFLSSPAATKSADMLRLRGEYERAEAELGALTATLGPRHPARIRAQSQIDTISRSIAQEVARLRTNAQLEYDNAQAEHDAAVAALKRLTGTFQTSDNARVQLRQLEREAESSRAVYEEALLRARETREQAQINTINMQVISEATPPLYKRFPPRRAILLPLALMIGFCGGAAFGLMLQMLRFTPPRDHRADAAPAGTQSRYVDRDPDRRPDRRDAEPRTASYAPHPAE
ncbi:MAG: GumC family protein [Rhodobiaceae bacterium]|nr:GumC family protein [Rhodobiaceae bacterium]MCC0055245.1 GumC family protein [Rhodobiaceae bacterium]